MTGWFRRLFRDVFEETNNKKTTDNFVYRTPANPNHGTSEPADRIFPIAYKGWRLVLIGLSIVVVPIKILIIEISRE